MTDDHRTIPYAFETQANKMNVPLEAMNFGVAGANISHYYKLIKDAVPIFKPEYLFILFFANDFPISQTIPSLFENSFQPLFTNILK